MVAKQCKIPLYFGLTSSPSLTALKRIQVRRDAAHEPHRDTAHNQPIKEIYSPRKPWVEEIGLVCLVFFN